MDLMWGKILLINFSTPWRTTSISSHSWFMTTILFSFSIVGKSGCAFAYKKPFFWLISAIYSILSDFWRLCFMQSNLTFFADKLVPPLENGRSWSKWRFFVSPQVTHLPWSLFQTSLLISDGMSLVCSIVIDPVLFACRAESFKINR